MIGRKAASRSEGKDKKDEAEENKKVFKVFAQHSLCSSHE